MSIICEDIAVVVRESVVWSCECAFKGYVHPLEHQVNAFLVPSMLLEFINVESFRSRCSMYAILRVAELQLIWRIGSTEKNYFTDFTKYMRSMYYRISIYRIKGISHENNHFI